MKNTAFFRVFGACVLMGAGVLLSGCKPDLTPASAQAMIQAEYDHRPPAGISITVDELGLKQGITANLWKLTKVYPNNRWADYTLTDAGKKALKLQTGGEVIQWRPELGGSFSFVVTSVATNHLRARDLKEIQDEVGGSKGVEFSESVNLDGVPDALQEMAHHPGNKLSGKHQADFTLEGGAWKLKSIE